MLEQRADLERALTRLRLNFYHLWRPLEELRSSEDPKTLLAEWRAARKPSQAWRKATFYREAVGILAVALSVPSEEAERLVKEHVEGHEAAA